MKKIINFLKGMLIGVATLIPGASGGTMSVILGVYDDLISAVGSFFKNPRKNVKLLLEIGSGALLGILVLSKLLEFAVSKYSYIMQFLFIGFILGGLPLLYHKYSHAKGKIIKDFLFFLIGLITVSAMSFEPQAILNIAQGNNILSFIFLFAAGIIIAIALVLPGISASFMLLTLGLYNMTLNAINDVNILFLIPLGLGLILGTLATAKVVEKLLKRYPSKTYMLILGFVAGSLIYVFPGIPQGLQWLSCTIAFLFGFISIFFISKKIRT